MKLERRIEGYLEKRKEEGTFRVLRQETGLVDFCSNDYLGVARLGILEEEVSGEGQLSTGSTGSRLISGNFKETEDLETSIAGFHQADAALLYNSGYVANVGFFSCVPRAGDTILYDELIHASVHDGMKMSKANRLAFRHNDAEDLAFKLKLVKKGVCFVAVETIYSMDGDEAPLPEIVAVCKQFKAYLVVDEAHATGIVGPKGAGLVQHYGLEEACFARIHTFGKSMGCHGAVILGTEQLKKYLINFSRSFIFTTALPPEAILRIKKAYEWLNESEDCREKLQNNIRYFLEQIKKTPWKDFLIPSQSAIQSIIIPDNEKVKEIAGNVRKEGFDLRPIVYPTVPRGQERIRICLHNYNTLDQIQNLVGLLNRF